MSGSRVALGMLLLLPLALIGCGQENTLPTTAVDSGPVYTQEQLEEWQSLIYQHVKIDGFDSGGITKKDGRSVIKIEMAPRSEEVVKKIRAEMASVGIPQDAVAIIVGCPVGEKFTPESVGGITDQAFVNLDAEVESPSEVKLGDPVTFTLKVSNAREDTVKIVFGHSNFVITRLDTTIVWSWWCERGGLTAQAFGTSLGPGEELAGFEFDRVGTWNQLDNRGNPVEPGEYLVYGVFSTIPRLVSEPVKLTIVR